MGPGAPKALLVFNSSCALRRARVGTGELWKFRYFRDDNEENSERLLLRILIFFFVY